MNQGNAKDYLPLVQALADGKLQIIQGGSWADVGPNDDIDFGGSPPSYRVKPTTFKCYKCGDDNTPLYCLNCAHEITVRITLNPKDTHGNK